MTSRERILAAINHQPVDRVPLDIWATGEVGAMLTAHFGSWAEAMTRLHIDGFGGTGPDYIGPSLQAPPGETVDYWGARFRKVPYATGSYEEQSCYPLADACTIDDLERYAWPSADWFDFSKVREKAQAKHDTHAIQAGYMAPFYFHNRLRGLETSLMDPYDDPEFTHHLIGRICDTFYAYHLRLFEAADGLIDVAQVTDDFGSQSGPLISLDIFREFYKPQMQRFIDLCHGFGIKVFHHDDGAIRPFIPEFIAMGVDILNPVQRTCPGMELEGLKRDFGHALCFHGGIENQQILPFGTPDEVRAEVRHNIDILANDGTGYILAPCHNLQPVTPLENILAMYDEAWAYGQVALTR